MNKQATFDKLQHDICAGMMIEHKFRSQMTGNSFDWFCTIKEVDATNNILVVTVTSAAGHSHPEEWDMRITTTGLNSGEYVTSKGNEE